MIDIVKSRTVISKYGVQYVSASYHDQEDETLFVLGKGRMYNTSTENRLKYVYGKIHIYLHEV